MNEIGVIVKDIFLFGSRARGDNKNDSDWDILIVTEHTFDIKEKMKNKIKN